MKYLKIIFLSFFIFATNINAQYVDVDKSQLLYDINNFKIVDDYIMINGWATGSNDQHMISDDTHDYYLQITNTKTNETYTYYGIKHEVDKTSLMKYNSNSRVANYNETYGDISEIYYLYTMVGFEFRIPLEDLNNGEEFSLKLQLHSKLINTYTQTDIYAFNIDEVITKDNYQYQLNSDIPNNAVQSITTNLYVRSGPGTSYAKKTSYIYSTSGGYTLYWHPLETYTNIIQAVQTNPGSIDSETWINIGYNDGLSYLNRSRAIDGNTSSGWGAFVYFIGVGNPAVINVTKISNTDINYVKTYTSNVSTIDVLLTNKIEQEINIIIKCDEEIIYNENITFIGEYQFDIEKQINDYSNITLEITEENNYKKTLDTIIYESENKEYIINDNFSQITFETPIYVYATPDEVIKYYETIYVNTTTYFNITNGTGFYPYINLKYESILENSNIISASIIDNDNELQLINDNNYFYLNDQYINFYGETTDEFIENRNTNGYYYPNLNELNIYEFDYFLENVGINCNSIIINSNYEISSHLFAVDALFNLIKVNTPTNLNLIATIRS